jgi:large subunit ribosomal protein L9
MNDKAEAERIAREKAEAMEISKQLSAMVLTVTAKGGGAGRLFGSVTNQEIADALKAKSGITLDKRKIVISDPIKAVGTYTVNCKLGYEITAPLTVKIEEA